MTTLFIILLVVATIAAPACAQRRGRGVAARNVSAAVCTPKRGPSVLLGSFNIQAFGPAKLGNNDAMKVIIKILGRYDLAVIVEVRDSSGSVIPTLVSKLNENNEKNPFKYVASSRLGRSNSKEQYVLLYRSRIQVKGTYEYADTNNVFERPPYLAVVELPNGLRFGIMMIHTKPEDAIAEINGLRDAYLQWSQSLRLNDTVIVGDFNADCSYVPKKAWSNIRLRTDNRFTWLIGDDDDTTTSATTCAYDRFVLAGAAVTSAVDKCSATEFRFDAAYQLTKEKTSDVSDHYPIEVAISTAG